MRSGRCLGQLKLGLRGDYFQPRSVGIPWTNASRRMAVWFVLHFNIRHFAEIEFDRRTTSFSCATLPRLPCTGLRKQGCGYADFQISP